MNQQTFIFIGRSGCGKGTQAKLLKEYVTALDAEHPVIYLSTGDKFRAFIAAKNHSSELSRQSVARGELQPTFLSIYLWASVLIENIHGGEHVIFDGVPRRLSEAKILETALDFYDQKQVNIVYLNVSEEWSHNRLLDRGRDDDVDEKSFALKMKWFTEHVEDAITYYRNSSHYNFFEINGERTIEEVHGDIVNNIFGDSR